MKGWIWLLCLCLWFPQAWAQKVQVFDPPGSVPGHKPAPIPAVVPPPPQVIEQPKPAAEVTPALSSSGEESVAAVEEKPAEPTQEEKDLVTIMDAVQKGTTIIQLVRDPILRPKLVNAYQKNPLTDLPEPLVRASVIGQFSQTAVGAWLIQNVAPLQNFLVEFVRDPVALGTLLKILNHTNDLMFYANVTIVLFFVMYFVRRQVLFTMESRFKRILVRLCFTFIFWYGSFWAYSAKFGEYLTPTWDIFKKHFF